MRPEDMRRRGTALADRVRREVDTSARLGIMLRQHRRQRVTAIAVAAAVAVALFVGALLTFTTEEDPVVTEPPTTAPSSLRSLPVQVFMVLVGEYTVDPGSGSCEGSGPLAGIGSGSLVHVWDESEYPGPDEAPAVALPPGVEVASDEERAAYLLSSGENTGCVFEMPDLGFDIDDYGHISLFPESDPNVAISSRRFGQRVVFTFGAEPGDQAFEPTGVASDRPEEWQAELQTLWDSAGPGRIVGSVALWGGHHTPLATSQPFCAGAARYESVQPGQSVVVADENGALAGESTLRGSAFDAHEGCSLWFGVDVPSNLSTYAIEIGNHPWVAFDRRTLDDFGWRINLWTDADQMQAGCVELEPGSRPMTCVLLEPPP